MNLMHRCCRLAMRSAAVLAIVTGAWACSDNDIKTSGDDPVNGPLDPVEAYTRAFVKEFGEFKGKPWGEAHSGAITVRTSRPTPVNVFAEIDGQRFIFASLGSVYGAQPVVVNIPAEVKELIVDADGSEYKVKLGEVLDLTEGSRYAGQSNYVDVIPSLGAGFNVNVYPRERTIKLDGYALTRTYFSTNDEYRTKKYFHIFDSDWNFTDALEDDGGSHNIYYGSRFYLNNANLTEFTVYPIYWRENSYGESDYLLGLYYYDYYGFELNGDRAVKMIDLEGIDVKQGISFKKTGSGEYIVNYSKEAFDAANIQRNDSVRFVGCHFKVDNLIPEGSKTSSARFGFYIKSGLKDTYTENKGRDYTHISFQNNMFNGIEWGDNYWDVPLKHIKHAYDGAIMVSTTASNYAWCMPVRGDGLPSTFAALGTKEAYKVIGFQSQPNGRSAEAPDFSDVVLAFTTGSSTEGIELAMKGETFGTYPWYIAAEDLGSTDDWDFNDLVVNVYDLTTDFTRSYVKTIGRYPTPTILGRRITVVPRAAGGTYPIYLMYQGEVSEAPTDETMTSAITGTFKKGTFVVGTELHAWLGEPDFTRMLNTGRDDGHTGGALSFCIPVIGSDELDFDIQNPPQNVGITNQTLRNFWVLVDKENKMQAELFNSYFDNTQLDPEYDNDLKKIRRNLSQTKNVLKEFSGKLGEGAYRVDPPKESGSYAPQMLMCHYRWQWPQERANIGDVYTSFRDWVAGKRTTWHGNPGEGEGTNGFFTDKVCGEMPIVWMQ